MQVSRGFMTYNNHCCPPVPPLMLVGINHLSQATTHYLRKAQLWIYPGSFESDHITLFFCMVVHAHIIFYSYDQSSIPWCLISESEIYTPAFAFTKYTACKTKFICYHSAVFVWYLLKATSIIALNFTVLNLSTELA